MPFSWASSIQSIPPHLTSWRSILILSSHLCLGFFPSGFLTKTLYTPLLSPVLVTYPAHLILLDFIIQTLLGEEYRSLSSSLCSFLHFPVTLSLLCLNILLNTLFSNTLSQHSSLSVNDSLHMFVNIVMSLQDREFYEAWLLASLWSWVSGLIPDIP